MTRTPMFYINQSARFTARAHRLVARQCMADLRYHLASGRRDAEHCETVWFYATLVMFYRDLARSSSARAR